MVKKILWVIFYCSCFFMLTLTIYRLACFVPPTPGEEGYRLYCFEAACVAVLISAATVVGIAALDLPEKP